MAYHNRPHAFSMKLFTLRKTAIRDLLQFNRLFFAAGAIYGFDESDHIFPIFTVGCHISSFLEGQEHFPPFHFHAVNLLTGNFPALIALSKLNVAPGRYFHHAFGSDKPDGDFGGFRSKSLAEHQGGGNSVFELDQS